MTAPDTTAIRALKSKRSKCPDIGNIDLSNVPESHETIWLQWGDNGGDDDTWCADNINDEDVPYIRADLVFALCDEVDRLRRMLDLCGTGPAERYWEGRWRDEAAEIERLRTIIDNLHAVEEKYRETANADFHRANRLQAENERLRADREQGGKDYCNMMDQRDALHVYAKKLEAALRPFVEYVHDDFRRGNATYELVATDRAGGGLIGAEDLRRARAALAQKGEE